MYNERTGQVCPDYARKGLRDGQNGRKADRSPIGRVPGYIPSTHLGMHFTSISRIMREKRKMLKKIDLTPDPPFLSVCILPMINSKNVYNFFLLIQSIDIF